MVLPHAPVPRLYSLESAEEEVMYSGVGRISIEDDDDDDVDVSSHDITPPPPPMDDAFCGSRTPKMNNCCRSNKRRRMRMMMLDNYDGCSSCSYPHPASASPSSVVLSGSGQHKMEERSKSTRKSLLVVEPAGTRRRRPTPKSCPLDDLEWLLCKESAFEEEEEESSPSSSSPRHDQDEPPALPVRRNALCPSNMPASVMIQLVMGR